MHDDETKVYSFFFVCFTIIILLGCARLTTTYSAFKVRDAGLEEIETLVDSAFCELGYSHGGPSAGEKKRSYQIWGEKNRFGVPLLYSFTATYKLADANISIRIESKELGATEDELRKIEERLSAVTSLIVSKLKAAKLNAVVETGSNWLPALGELP